MTLTIAGPAGGAVCAVPQDILTAHHLHAGGCKHIKNFNLFPIYPAYPSAQSTCVPWQCTRRVHWAATCCSPVPVWKASIFTVTMTSTGLCAQKQHRHLIFIINCFLVSAKAGVKPSFWMDILNSSFKTVYMPPGTRTMKANQTYASPAFQLSPKISTVVLTAYNF